ncbi:MAG: hypothetical protein QXS20_02975 [Candidatus Thorarchaeota archaeon]
MGKPDRSVDGSTSYSLSGGRSRFVLLSIATLLLNIGLFPVFAILSPFMVGLATGHLARHALLALLMNALVALIGYGILFFLVLGSTDLLLLLQGAALMAVIAGLGGLAGSLTVRKGE